MKWNLAFIFLSYNLLLQYAKAEKDTVVSGEPDSWDINYGFFGDLTSEDQDEEELQMPYFDDKNLVNEDTKNLKLIYDYMPRFVNLFLNILELKNSKIKADNELFEAHLEVSITGAELAFLQEFSKSNMKIAFLEKDLSKLDEIINRMILLKKKSTAAEWMDFFFMLFQKFSFYASDFDRYIGILLATLLCITVSPNFRKFSFAFISFLIFNYFIIIESWMKYQQKKKEAYDFPFKENKETSIDSSYFMKFFKKFFFNPSENSKESMEVTFLNTLFDTYGFYLLEKPAKLLGKTLRIFSSELSENLIWPLRSFVGMAVSIFLLLLIAIVTIFSLGTFRIRWFGSRIEVGVSNNSLPPSPPQPHSIGSQNPTAQQQYSITSSDAENHHDKETTQKIEDVKNDKEVTSKEKTEK